MKIEREPDFDILLREVERPGRYIGNEIFSIRKDSAGVDVTWGLFFPDVYEVGMSYLGFQILYHILNQQDFIAAERIFSPWPDFEQRLRDFYIPLFSLESKKPVCSFDIVGITLQYELHASNIVNGLELGGVPVFSKDRREGDPIVIAGGPNATNPEPLADFLDAVVIGDGEKAVLEISDVVRTGKRNRWSRQDMLNELANLPGVYVPAFYEPSYNPEGRFVGIRPVRNELNLPVLGRVETIEESFYSRTPVVPLIRTTHERLSVEVMRGCTRGCRFCHAGFYYRPSRERSAKDVASYIKETAGNIGCDELSLVSLSTSDYTQLPELWKLLQEFLAQNHISLALPSLRPETISPELLRLLGTEKKSGLTIAPEAGTQRLRDVINKFIQEEDIFQAAEIAFAEGWKLIKLYFMIGLPTETDEDLLGMSDLLNRLGRVARKSGAKIKASISPFTPKAHTPFQWVAQDSVQELERKIRIIRHHLRGRNIELNWRNPEVTRLEGILARGDRRLAPVIYRAWQAGARFDAWTDQFRWEIWEKALREYGLSEEEFTRARSLDEPLPWEHLQRGIDRSFLEKQFQAAQDGVPLSDCKYDSCHLCGFMRYPSCRAILKRQKKQTSPGKQKAVFRWQEPKPVLAESKKDEQVTYYRIRYAKTGWMRFIGHLDMAALLLRTFRMARLPLVYSQGYSPHPRVSFGPPLPLGQESLCEWMDLRLTNPANLNIRDTLNRIWPRGLRVLDVQVFSDKPPALENWLQVFVYRVSLPENELPEFLVERFREQESVLFLRKSKRGEKKVDLKRFVTEIAVENDKTIRIGFKKQNGQIVKVSDFLRYGMGMSEQKIADCKITRIFMGPEEAWEREAASIFDQKAVL